MYLILCILSNYTCYYYIQANKRCDHYLDKRHIRIFAHNQAMTGSHESMLIDIFCN